MKHFPSGSRSGDDTRGNNNRGDNTRGNNTRGNNNRGDGEKLSEVQKPSEPLTDITNVIQHHKKFTDEISPKSTNTAADLVKRLLEKDTKNGVKKSKKGGKRRKAPGGPRGKENQQPEVRQSPIQQRPEGSDRLPQPGDNSGF